MKTLIRHFVMLSSLTLIVGCSSGVRLKIQRAPELNLVGVKTVKIKPFDVSGSLSLDLVGSGGGLLGAVVGVAADAGANKLAESKSVELQADHIQGLKGAIFQNGVYKVSDGEDYDALITGNVVYEVTDEGEEVDEKDGDGKTVRKYAISRDADLRINFTVAKKNGEIIGTSEVKTKAKVSAKGKNQSEARDNMAAWTKVVRDAVKNSHDPVVMKIAPYFVYEKRTFEKGKSSSIKSGNKAAKAGNWEQAVKLWQEGGASGNNEDKVAAAYNMGIYEEAEGRLLPALANFEEARQISGKAKFDRDIVRTKSRVEEERKLKEAAASR